MRNSRIQERKRDGVNARKIKGKVAVPKDTGRHVATTANGDHEVRCEVIKDALSRLLAQLVHLFIALHVSLWDHHIGLV